MPEKISHRHLTISEWESKRDDSGAPVLVGYAAVFDQPTEIWGMYVEVLKRGAFARAIREKADVKALYSHERAALLGRTGNGTLTLREDDHGLAVEIHPPDTQVGRDVVALVTRGDLDGMSFAFWEPPREFKWIEAQTKDDLPTREIYDLDLIEVTLTAFPQYEGTEIEAREIREMLETAGVIPTDVQVRDEGSDEPTADMQERERWEIVADSIRVLS